MSATTADFSNLSMTAPSSSMPRLPPVSSLLNLAEAGSSSRYNLPQGAPHDDRGLLNPVSQTYSRLCQLILLHRLSGKPKILTFGMQTSYPDERYDQGAKKRPAIPANRPSAPDEDKLKLTPDEERALARWEECLRGSVTMK